MRARFEHLRYSGSDDDNGHTSDEMYGRLGRTPKAKAYERALMIAQRELAELREKFKASNTENKELKREIALLKESQSSAPSRKPHQTTGIAADIEHSRTLAKLYTALYEPFSTIYNNPNLFTLPRPSSECLLPERRFCTSKTARQNGWLAQLYDFLPEHLHSMVRDYSEFEAEFRAAAKAMRSALIDRVRKAAPTVFNLPAEIFKQSYKREKVTELTRLLKFNPHSKHLSNLPPVLYPLSVRRKGREGFETKLFQVLEIFRLMKALLFGLASLDSTEKHGGPPTYGKQWGVLSLEELPFYAIPVFALLTVFVISEDSDFSSEGTRSGRDWEGYFDYLRKQFHAANGTNEFQKIMRKCQDIVFDRADRQNSSQVHDDSKSDASSDVDWQAQALQLSDEDDNQNLSSDDNGFFGNTSYGEYDDLDNYDDIDDDGSPPRPRAGPSTLTLPTLVSSSSSQLPAPRQASQPGRQTGMLTTLLSPVVEEQSSTIPVTPQRASTKRSKGPRKALHSTTSDVDLLFTLPPPVTPKKHSKVAMSMSHSPGDFGLGPSPSPVIPEQLEPNKRTKSSKKTHTVMELSDEDSSAMLAVQPAPKKKTKAMTKTLRSIPDPADEDPSIATAAVPRAPKKTTKASTIASRSVAEPLDMEPFRTLEAPLEPRTRTKTTSRSATESDTNPLIPHVAPPASKKRTKASTKTQRSATPLEALAPTYADQNDLTQEPIQNAVKGKKRGKSVTLPPSATTTTTAPERTGKKQKGKAKAVTFADKPVVSGPSGQKRSLHLTTTV